MKTGLLAPGQTKIPRLLFHFKKWLTLLRPSGSSNDYSGGTTTAFHRTSLFGLELTPSIILFLSQPGRLDK